MDNILKKYFKVSEKNSEPLYMQVKDGINSFIADHQPGDKIPSEHALALFLKVNRETIRKAILTFVEDGRLLRNQKGTFISEVKKVTDIEKPHPLIFQNIFPSPKIITIKFALYENLPNQKEFWNETVETFNRIQSNAAVNIEWVSNKVKNLEKYCEYLIRTKPGVFQMSQCSEPLFRQRNLLTKPPEIIKQKLNSNNYWNFNSSMSIPVHFPTWGIFWNKALVEKYNIKNVKERIVAGELLDIFREISSCRSDDNVFASGTIWNYLCALGLPEFEKIEVSEFFRERFNHISNLENVFMLKENSFLESRDLFRDEKVIFYISTNWFISNYTDSFKFPMDILWNIPQKGCHCCSSASSIGIYNTQDASEMDVAVKFAEYLLSEGVQKRLVQRNLNCSVLKEVNREILGGQSNPDFERMKCSCDKLSASEFVSSMNSFLMFEIRDLYAKVIKGQINYKDAARVAEKRWKSFLDEKGACYVSD